MPCAMFQEPGAVLADWDRVIAPSNEFRGFVWTGSHLPAAGDEETSHQSRNE